MFPSLTIDLSFSIEGSATALHKDRRWVELNINQSFILPFNVRIKGHVSRLGRFKYSSIYGEMKLPTRMLSL